MWDKDFFHELFQKSVDVTKQGAKGIAGVASRTWSYGAEKPPQVSEANGSYVVEGAKAAAKGIAGVVSKTWSYSAEKAPQAAQATGSYVASGAKATGSYVAEGTKAAAKGIAGVASKTWSYSAEKAPQAAQATGSYVAEGTKAAAGLVGTGLSKGYDGLASVCSSIGSWWSRSETSVVPLVPENVITHHHHYIAQESSNSAEVVKEVFDGIKEVVKSFNQALLRATQPREPALPPAPVQPPNQYITNKIVIFEGSYFKWFLIGGASVALLAYFLRRKSHLVLVLIRERLSGTSKTLFVDGNLTVGNFKENFGIPVHTPFTISGRPAHNSEVLGRFARINGLIVIEFSIQAAIGTSDLNLVSYSGF